MALPSSAGKKEAAKDYVVLASTAVRDDAEWMKAVTALQKRHGAEVFYFEKSPREVEDALKAAYPRYVAIVEKPENLGRDFVIDFHKLSREMDDDIYEDFLDTQSKSVEITLDDCKKGIVGGLVDSVLRVFAPLC